MVRRLEAVGLRAWPAALVHYDGAWQIRLTAAHPSRRLNSVNPLDRSDDRDIEARVGNAVSRFEAFGRPPVFRHTPLSPVKLDKYLVDEGWQRRSETIVMLAELEGLALKAARDQLPLRDLSRYVSISATLQDRDQAMARGLEEVLRAIRPTIGPFVIENAGEGPVATALCVHDNDLAGMFEIATGAAFRQQGFGCAVVETSLKWARLRGARKAWLQVEAANGTARRLYERIGFSELYRYSYLERPGAADER